MPCKAGIGPGVWTFDTGLIGVCQCLERGGPRSKRSKTAIVVRFGENSGEIFGSLEQHSGFSERATDTGKNTRRERERARKDRRLIKAIKTEGGTERKQMSGFSTSHSSCTSVVSLCEI